MWPTMTTMRCAPPHLAEGQEKKEGKSFLSSSFFLITDWQIDAQLYSLNDAQSWIKHLKLLPLSKQISSSQWLIWHFDPLKAEQLLEARLCLRARRYAALKPSSGTRSISITEDVHI